ncbi:hypothetical protein ScPMuIL_002039 [Solemya velum]
MTNVERTAVIILLYISLSSTVLALTYYCNQLQTVQVSNQENGTISTLELGKAEYDNNVLCKWVIDAGEDNRIHFTVTSTELQWAPSYALCDSYDLLDIKDGNAETSPSIFTMCGERNPYSLLTSGRYAYLKFSTNDQNPYKYSYSGVTLTFQTFPADQCPPGWKQLTSEPFCYSIPDKPDGGADWSSAQHFCNYNQANLIVMKNESDFSLIQGYGVGKGIDAAWIGLSDISHESRFQWLDNTHTTFSKFTGSNPDGEDMDCVVQDFNAGKWLIKHCEREKFPYICKTVKGNKTTILGLPEDKNLDDAAADSSFIIAITLGVLAGLVVVIGSLAVYCYIQGKRHNRRKQSQSRTEETSLRTIDDSHSSRPNRRHWFNTTHTIDRLDDRPEPSAPHDATGPPSYAEALGDSQHRPYDFSLS